MQMNSEFIDLRNKWAADNNMPFVCRWHRKPDISKVNLDRRSEGEEKASALYDGERIGTYKGRDI